MAGLGDLYAEGKGGAKDYAKAREWYEKAADKGNANAMALLGGLYANGQGGPPDDAKAREWYGKAAANGVVYATDLLAYLNIKDANLNIKEATEAGRYSDALRLQEALAANAEANETEREGHPGAGTVRELTSVAWYALFARGFQKALAASDRAHTLLPSNLNVETNRAHALMFLGRDKEASALYLAYKGKRISDSDAELWEQVIARDFADLRKGGLSNPLMDGVLNRLGVSR